MSIASMLTSKDSTGDAVGEDTFCPIIEWGETIPNYRESRYRYLGGAKGCEGDLKELQKHKEQDLI